MALGTFTLLCTSHHHPSPEFFTFLNWNSVPFIYLFIYFYLLSFDFVIIAILTGLEWCLVDLICILLMTRCVEYLFIYPSAICMFLWKISIQVLCLFWSPVTCVFFVCMFVFCYWVAWVPYVFLILILY